MPSSYPAARQFCPVPHQSREKRTSPPCRPSFSLPWQAVFQSYFPAFCITLHSYEPAYFQDKRTGRSAFFYMRVYAYYTGTISFFSYSFNPNMDFLSTCPKLLLLPIFPSGQPIGTPLYFVQLVLNFSGNTAVCHKGEMCPAPPCPSLQSSA